MSGAIEHRLAWRGVDLLVRHTPNRWDAVSHLEVRVLAPPGAAIPITHTGYRSRFLPLGFLETFEGGPVAYVTGWLEEAAQSKQWIKSQERRAQLDLF